MNEVKSRIMELTETMESSDYIWFMLELSDWTHQEAVMAEYGDTLLDNDD